MWLNQYNPLAFDFEDLQSLDDLESCNLSNSSSPPEFALPSPISDASPLNAEDLFDQKSFIEPWLIPTAFENSTATPAAPCNSPTLSAPSLASSPSSSESNSLWGVDRDVELKKSKSTVSLRTGKKNQLSETSRGKSASPIGKGQKNSHNLIEKRYRNKLNSKINALRDSIPSLCSTVKEEEEGEDAMDSDSGGMRKAQKCNKGIIIDKAIQYIAELEKEVQRLSKENSRLETIVKGWIPNYLMLGLNKTMGYA